MSFHISKKLFTGSSTVLPTSFSPISSPRTLVWSGFLASPADIKSGPKNFAAFLPFKPDTPIRLQLTSVSDGRSTKIVEGNWPYLLPFIEYVVQLTPAQESNVFRLEKLTTKPLRTHSTFSDYFFKSVVGIRLPKDFNVQTWLHNPTKDETLETQIYSLMCDNDSNTNPIEKLGVYDHNDPFLRFSHNFFRRFLVKFIQEQPIDKVARLCFADAFPLKLQHAWNHPDIQFHNEVIGGLTASESKKDDSTDAEEDESWEEADLLPGQKIPPRGFIKLPELTLAQFKAVCQMRGWTQEQSSGWEQAISVYDEFKKRESKKNSSYFQGPGQRLCCVKSTQTNDLLSQRNELLEANKVLQWVDHEGSLLVFRKKRIDFKNKLCEYLLHTNQEAISWSACSPMVESVLAALRAKEIMKDDTDLRQVLQLLQGEQGILTMVGKAGSGKTTMEAVVAAVLLKTWDREFKGKVKARISATSFTNKAVETMRNKFHTIFSWVFGEDAEVYLSRVLFRTANVALLKRWFDPVAENSPMLSGSEQKPVDVFSPVLLEIWDECSMDPENLRTHYAQMYLELWQSQSNKYKDIVPRLLVVGDIQQIPSFGDYAGSLMEQIIVAARKNVFAFHELKVVYRQGADSSILKNANHIAALQSSLNIRDLTLDNSFKLVDDNAIDWIREITTYASQFQDESLSRLQILTPTVRNMTYFNSICSWAKNGSRLGIHSSKQSSMNKIFCVGDRIICTKRITREEGKCIMFNGDTDEIKQIVCPGPNKSTRSEKWVERTFPSDKGVQIILKSGRILSLRDKFELAYALTPNRMQGSQQENVWLCVREGPGQLDFFSRNHLYTSITRASRTFRFYAKNSQWMLATLSNKPHKFETMNCHLSCLLLSKNEEQSSSSSE